MFVNIFFMIIVNFFILSLFLSMWALIKTHLYNKTPKLFTCFGVVFHSFRYQDYFLYFLSRYLAFVENYSVENLFHRKCEKRFYKQRKIQILQKVQIIFFRCIKEQLFPLVACKSILNTFVYEI